MGVLPFGAKLFAYPRGCPKKFVESALSYRLELRKALFSGQIPVQKFSTFYLWLSSYIGPPIVNQHRASCLPIGQNLIHHQPGAVLHLNHCLANQRLFLPCVGTQTSSTHATNSLLCPNIQPQKQSCTGKNAEAFICAHLKFSFV